MAQYKIAIVGCGMGGLSSGMLLARLGHEITIFERFEEPKSIGAGILIQPSGLVALERLGLLEQVEAKSARIDAFLGTTTTGRRVMDVRYADGWTGSYGLGVHRGNLFHALYEAARAAGIGLRCGASVADAVPAGNGNYLCLSARAETFGEFDAVIVANGAQSALRGRLNVKQRSIPYPWGALWAICPDPERRYQHTLVQRYEGSSVMIGVLPTGLHPQTDIPCVSFFWSIRASDYPAWLAGDFGKWKSDVVRYWPELEYLLQCIPDASALTFATYGDVLMRQWHDGALLCIGDAGHGMSPQLGMGANLALIDSLVLADCVAEAANLPEAFARYSRERRRHLRYNQLASRALTPFFQSDSRLAALARDIFFPMLRRTPPLYKEALRTVAGVKTGLLFDKSFVDLSEPVGKRRPPLYRRILGETWSALPEAIRALHHPAGRSWDASGIATVERGSGLLSRFVGALFRFPHPGQNIPVRVVFELKQSGEIWRRTFNGRSFESFQWEGADKLLCERFGVFSFGLTLVAEGIRLNLIVRRWSFLGVPLPLALAPIGQTYESVENGRFRFHVEIAHSLLGLIVRYQGWLALNNEPLTMVREQDRAVFPDYSSFS